MSPPRIAISKIMRLAALHVPEEIPSVYSLAKVLRISRPTVRKYKELIRASGYSYADFATLSPRRIRAILTKITTGRRPRERYTRLLTVFPQVHAQLSDGVANLKQAWTNYRMRDPNGYGFSQFVWHFYAWRKSQGLPAVACTKWRIRYIAQTDVLELKRWRRSNDRIQWAKAVVVLGSSEGLGLMSLCSKVEKSPRVVKSWINDYIHKGIDSLRSNRNIYFSPEKTAEMKKKRDRIVSVLHETPQIHGINRTSWSLSTLAQAYEKQYDESIGVSTLSDYVRAEGYRFKKARRVLTSPDPTYREKLQEITRVLSNLRDDERFFSIDEYGPFSVKMQGGLALTPKGTIRAVPQCQKSKGSLIVTAALELSKNQITHFYSDKKNTNEMIRLLDILLCQYSDQRCLYLSWDAASWHVSAKLKERVTEVNFAAEAGKSGIPFVKLMSLPASAQFLNVIESVFSGMARAIIHNSDYQCMEDCRAAIDRYFAERNQSFLRNPQRAGKKIWGSEIVKPCFSPNNNCKDPNWR